MAATVNDIYRIIDGFAPFDTQEEWDNAGILAGRGDGTVNRVLVALDVTEGAVAEAKALGCELLVTHHPILFHARKNLREDDPEGRALCALVRAGLAHIAAHTNFDQAAGGVNDVLAGLLGLTQVEALPGGLRGGRFGGTLAQLCDRAERALGAVVRPYGDANAPIERLAVCGGAGGGLWRTAWDAGYDGYLTGEIHHNDALDAAAMGLKLAEAGHWSTEHPSVKELRNALQKGLDALQYNVMVFESAYTPF